MIDYESVHAERLTGMPVLSHYYITEKKLSRVIKSSNKNVVSYNRFYSRTGKSTYAPDRLSTNSKQNKRKGL